MKKLVNTHINGNARITLYDDGTRVIEYEDALRLAEPLNIDIRVTSKCAYGYNPATNKGVCNFCHESASIDGSECNYIELIKKLSVLSPGVELAIGGNEITDGLIEFLVWAKECGHIVNLTINQGHVVRDYSKLEYLIDNQLIHGLGVSYRSFINWNVPKKILEYPNTVFHVIIGIDSIASVMALHIKGVKKILCLGEKDFGYNAGKVNLDSRNHKEWVWWVQKLFSLFDVVSFDNLALEQLMLKRFFTEENWARFNNGEHSLYINAVQGYLAPSSRSSEKTDWNDISITEYFNTHIEQF